MKLNVGCGVEIRQDFVNVDIRSLPGKTDVQADVRRLPFPDGTFEEIVADSVFEHLTDPRQAIAESARILRPEGRLIVRVPALGTNAAHLDPTHRYLADLKHWTELLSERFGQVAIGSVGVRWRSHRGLVLLQKLCIAIFGWHELGQCWVLTARKPKPRFERVIPPRWWLDDDQPMTEAIASATSAANRPGS